MVIYELQCPSLHKFEGWFKDPTAFHKQLKQRLIHCTYCGSDAVQQVPAGCHLGTPSALQKTQPSQTTSPSSPQVTPRSIDVVTLTKAVQKVVKKHFRNAGSKFTDQAIQMHKGEIASENIYGTANQQDCERLDQEGVSFLPLPQLPESFEN